MSRHIKIQQLLGQLADELCSCERDFGGGSTLVLVPHNSTRPTQVFVDGKSLGQQTTFDPFDAESMVHRVVRLGFETRAEDAAERGRPAPTPPCDTCNGTGSLWGDLGSGQQCGDCNGEGERKVVTQ